MSIKRIIIDKKNSWKPQYDAAKERRIKAKEDRKHIKNTWDSEKTHIHSHGNPIQEQKCNSQVNNNNNKKKNQKLKLKNKLGIMKMDFQ